MSVYQALITIDPGTFIAQICNLLIQLFIQPLHRLLDSRHF